VRELVFSLGLYLLRRKIGLKGSKFNSERRSGVPETRGIYGRRENRGGGLSNSLKKVFESAKSEGRSLLGIPPRKMRKKQYADGSFPSDCPGGGILLGMALWNGCSRERDRTLGFKEGVRLFVGMCGGRLFT